MDAYVYLSFAPSSSGFAVGASGAAQALLPHYPQHVAFWTFSSLKDAQQFAAKVARLANLPVRDCRESDMFMSNVW